MKPDRMFTLLTETRSHAMEVDQQKLVVKFVRTPSLGDVPYPVVMEPNLVVEYYAKN